MASEFHKSILLVEDDYIIASTEKEILQRDGYRVIHVSTGGAAIELVKQGVEPIDLILMDVNLGHGIDGTQAAKSILAIRQIPVLFLSSHTEPEVVAKTEEISSYGYVVKNSGDVVLSASVKMAFRLHASNEKIAESAEQFEAIAQSSMDGISVVDLQGRFLEVNDVYCRISGYARAELLTMSIADVEASESPELLQQHLDDIVRNKSLRFETKHRRKDGRVFDVEVSATYLPRRGCINGFMRDISERKETERAILESEDRYRSVISALHDGIIMHNAKGAIVGCNPRAESILGLTREQMMGRTSIDAHWYSVHEDGSDYPGETHPAMITLTTGKPERDIVMGVHKPDGSLTWISINTQPLTLPGNTVPHAVVASFSDITEGRRSIEALYESRERLKLALSGADTGMWSVDVTTMSGRVDEGAARILGYTKDEIPKTIEWWNTLAHPDDIPLISQRLNNHLEGRTPVFESEHRMRHLSGEYRWVIGKGKVTRRDASGFPIEVSGTMVDITDRKIAEDKIQQLLAEKELLLKEVHHRIKNSMNTVRSVLSMQRSVTPDPTAKRVLQDAEDRIRGMLLLYEKLYKTEQFTSVAVDEYLSQLVAELVDNFPNRDRIILTTHYDSFHLDPKRMSTLGLILTELVTNSMKYAFEGRPGGLMSVSARKANGCIELIVKDDGVGIPSSFRLDGSQGLGLQLVHMLTSQLKGVLHPEWDNGSTWKLTFHE